MRKTRLSNALNNMNFLIKSVFRYNGQKLEARSFTQQASQLSSLISCPSTEKISEQCINDKYTKRQELNSNKCSLINGSGGVKPTRPPVANYAPIIPIDTSQG
ncbi:hypothetical protein J8L98_13400 [Pseudoalteromonas sp. MMG013]|uniref:hypothetical protein n=1 Tax=Pseudoalteromonas sp. MMG013 TaxID=2822687 RepID=UPI001B38D093|nr:hypothetical protein [Pseudoalteromonas sp. MMG013]MBQ4862686.1 hypothetical protein [Pseudoalteromonas sp. MMG013]